MLDKLIKLANELDQRGYTKEASQIDALIRKEAGRHELFRALKSDDVDGAIKSLVGMNNEDLGITTEEFKKLTQDLTNAKSYESHDPAESVSWMEIARKRLGVEKPEVQTVKTHNPVTGLPWSSGPVEESKGKDYDDYYLHKGSDRTFVKGMLGKEVDNLMDLTPDEVYNLEAGVLTHIEKAEKLGAKSEAQRGKEFRKWLRTIYYTDAFIEKNRKEQEKYTY